MRPTELSAIAERLSDASWLTAITGLILILATGSAETGETTFGPQRIIQQTDADAAHSVFAADLDGDGDQDILSASFDDDKIAWYENTDGMGAFGPPQVITTAAGNALSVFAADLDGEGDA